MTPCGTRGGPQVSVLVREVMFDNKSILGGDIGPMSVKNDSNNYLTMHECIAMYSKHMSTS